MTEWWSILGLPVIIPGEIFHYLVVSPSHGDISVSGLYLGEITAILINIALYQWLFSAIIRLLQWNRSDKGTCQGATRAARGRSDSVVFCFIACMLGSVYVVVQVLLRDYEPWTLAGAAAAFTVGGLLFWISGTLAKKRSEKTTG